MEIEPARPPSWSWPFRVCLTNWPCCVTYKTSCFGH